MPFDPSQHHSQSSSFVFHDTNIMHIFKLQIFHSNQMEAQVETQPFSNLILRETLLDGTSYSLLFAN